MKSILKCILLLAFYTCTPSVFAQSNCGSGGCQHQQRKQKRKGIKRQMTLMLFFSYD